MNRLATLDDLKEPKRFCLLTPRLPDLVQYMTTHRDMTSNEDMVKWVNAGRLFVVVKETPQPKSSKKQPQKRGKSLF